MKGRKCSFVTSNKLNEEFGFVQFNFLTINKSILISLFNVNMLFCMYYNFQLQSK